MEEVCNIISQENTVMTPQHIGGEANARYKGIRNVVKHSSVVLIAGWVLFLLHFILHVEVFRAETTNASIDVGVSSMPFESPKNKTMPIASQSKFASLDMKKESIMYIHVGKTGGTTLDAVLRSNCEWYLGASAERRCRKSFEQEKPSLLSNITKCTLHFGPRKDFEHWLKNTSMFLMTLRNPITRATSAFNFDHPKKNQHVSKFDHDTDIEMSHFYEDCFPDVQSFVRWLETTKRSTWHAKFPQEHSSCHDLAAKALTGNGPRYAASHLRMNYQHYYRMSIEHYPSRPLLVARTEYLWEDISGIDRLLGGDGNFTRKGLAYTHGSQFYGVSNVVSTHEKRILCCYLVEELKLYEYLLRRAENLSPTDKNQTMLQLYNDCGINPNRSITWIHWEAATCASTT